MVTSLENMCTSCLGHGCTSGGRQVITDPELDEIERRIYSTKHCEDCNGSGHYPFNYSSIIWIKESVYRMDGRDYELEYFSPAQCSEASWRRFREIHAKKVGQTLKNLTDV